MKCDLCGERATTHLTEIADGVPRPLHLCKEHAKLRYQQDPFAGAQHLLERTAVTVEVTPSQIEREELVSVDLPDGGTRHLKLSTRMTDGFAIADLPSSMGGPTEELHCLTIRVVPEEKGSEG